MNLFENESLGSNACYRIPTISLVPNGDLIAIVDERIDSCDDLRKNEDINLVIRRSVDSGINWSPTKKLIDLPMGESASDASLIIDRLNKSPATVGYEELKLQEMLYSNPTCAEKYFKQYLRIILLLFIE